MTGKWRGNTWCTECSERVLWLWCLAFCTGGAVRAASCVYIQHSAVTQTACSLCRTAQAVSRRFIFYTYRYTSPDTRKCNSIYTLNICALPCHDYCEILKRPTAPPSGLLYRIGIKTKDKSGQSNRIRFTAFSNCYCFGSTDRY